MENSMWAGAFTRRWAAPLCRNRREKSCPSQGGVFQRCTSSPCSHSGLSGQPTFLSVACCRCPHDLFPSLQSFKSAKYISLAFFFFEKCISRLRNTPIWCAHPNLVRADPIWQVGVGRRIATYHAYPSAHSSLSRPAHFLILFRTGWSNNTVVLFWDTPFRFLKCSIGIPFSLCYFLPFFSVILLSFFLPFFSFFVIFIFFIWIWDYIFFLNIIWNSQTVFEIWKHFSK